ncbi:hypothetical protein DBV05_g7478 [Lasiodiplodia theobromae]|uniref:Uncharacterized protein n=1 Tax=Lasiodiplodia theobromae TaxID=45133 RepID=A0A5N5D9G7_9PEZI|nr:hypothetical protein DBV05_g7478 [Lasiodiplodia theobromae]
MNKVKPSKTSAPSYPEFDSLSAYLIDDQTARTFRTAEAERLSDVVKNLDRPLILRQSAFLRRLKGDEDGYRTLSRLSQTILTALSLCLLDNECINVEFCTRLANRERLQKLIQQAKLAADMTEPVGSETGEPASDDSDQKLDAAFDIVNYISAILVRLVCQTGVGDYWLANVMAVLVARIAKIKVLLMDIVSSAATSAAAGEDALEKSQGSSRFSMGFADEEEECEEALRLIEANTKEGLTSEAEAEVSSYCVNQNKYRSGINAALKYILLSLRIMNRSGLPPTSYEMCLVVYDIGFSGFKTVLFQDRDLEYSASSDRSVLNTAQPALVILNQTLQHLKHKPRTQDSGSEGSTETFVEWAFLEKNLDASSSSLVGGIDYNELSTSLRKVRLSSLADIVNVMVPLIATSPILLADFTNFRTMMALSGGVEDVVTPFQEGHFGAFFRLYTDDFEREAESREILRLSQAFREQRFSRCRLLTESHSKWITKIWNTPQKSTDPVVERVGTQRDVLPLCDQDNERGMQKKLDACVACMQGWVVDETSVTIPCKTYVWTVMGAAMLLAGGGVAIGFTVGGRIQAVDPFNLATYTWVLAAFVILICKAVLVENWTWSDFLHQRVKCRSVSELAATTRIDEQLIMAKLLHDDCGGTILLTRGPYNSVFRRQTDGTNGFSIDRPISAETLMLSGLALLKVVTPRGHAIVCLDYRCGWSARMCSPISLRLAKVEDFKWKRVQGVYEFHGAKVLFE